MKLINMNELLKYSMAFNKAAQTMSYTADPMKSALDKTIGQGVKSAILAAFQKSVTNVQVNIEYNPDTKSAKFVVYGNGVDADKNELTNALNLLSQKAYVTMSKYQKTPLDYKYVEYNKQ